jgi:ankyrin repeat protein
MGEAREHVEDNGYDIYTASSVNDLVALQALLVPGCNIHWRNAAGRSPLHVACARNHALCARFLVDAGHSPNARDSDGCVPLHCCIHHRGMVQLLLDSSAELDVCPPLLGYTPLSAACLAGAFAAVRLLCAYGASREIAHNSESRAKHVAVDSGYSEIAAWLDRTRRWTPLHYIEEISADRARELLRAGGGIHACRTETVYPRTHSTPLSRAQDVASASDIADKAAALLLLRVAGGWSPTNHDLFPAATRDRAWVLMRFGYLLSTHLNHRALIDVWRSVMLPQALE